MKLYLVQHAEAVPKDLDPSRPLSEKGEADAAKMTAFLAAAGISVDEVAHSGKARARQTANALAKAVWPDEVALQMDGLAPNDSTDHALHAAQTAGGDMMLVGHLPFMARLAARCLTGAEDGLNVAFEPGAVVCLDRQEDGGWAFAWMQRPGLLANG